ncbi:MAG: hypothetical protein Q7R79_02715 [bacterium]|nr:hypothetical protein [bacterium]
MNIWTKKSIELARAQGYLDSLSDIYVMSINPQRPLTEEVEKKIRSAFFHKKTKVLVHLLIQNKVFPVKDSYVGFLRLNPTAIDQNPITIKRIGDRLYSLGIENLIKEATRPTETNRQLGQSFKKWLPQLGYPVLGPEDLARTRGVAILEGGDTQLAHYAREKLGCRLSKGIDFLLKKGDCYLIGEAKFLTTPGGEQDRGFDDASNFIKGKFRPNVTRIAVLDGYIWVERTGGLHKKIVTNNLDIFSALLLPEYIKKF